MGCITKVTYVLQIEPIPKVEIVPESKVDKCNPPPGDESDFEMYGHAFDDRPYSCI